MNTWLHNLLPRDAQAILMLASLKAADMNDSNQCDLRRRENVMQAAIVTVRAYYPEYFKEHSA